MSDQPTQFTYTPATPAVSINATYREGSPLDSLTIELSDQGMTAEVFDAAVEFIARLSERADLPLDRVVTETPKSHRRL